MADPVVVHTDGGASGNPGPGGYGAILQWGGHRKEFTAGYRLTTNNRMELLAVIVALEALNRDGVEVWVVSDSKYVIDSVDKGWVFNWKKRASKARKTQTCGCAFCGCTASTKSGLIGSKATPATP